MINISVQIIIKSFFDWLKTISSSVHRLGSLGIAWDHPAKKQVLLVGLLWNCSDRSDLCETLQSLNQMPFMKIFNHDCSRILIIFYMAVGVDLISYHSSNSCQNNTLVPFPSSPQATSKQTAATSGNEQQQQETTRCNARMLIRLIRTKRNYNYVRNSITNILITGAIAMDTAKSNQGCWKHYIYIFEWDGFKQYFQVFLFVFEKAHTNYSKCWIYSAVTFNYVLLFHVSLLNILIGECK